MNLFHKIHIRQGRHNFILINHSKSQLKPKLENIQNFAIVMFPSIIHRIQFIQNKINQK